MLLINNPELYPPPIIVPPVPADDPSCVCPSDHSTVFAPPLANTGLGQTLNEYTTKVCRPLPESGKIEFGQWITQQTWDCINDASPDDQVEALQKMMTKFLDEIFPTKISDVGVQI